MYIKINDSNYTVKDDGISFPNDTTFELIFYGEGLSFTDVHEYFKTLNTIDLYTLSENGAYLASSYDNYELQKIAFDISKNLYTVGMKRIDQTTQRLTELEDAVNFLLMGGNASGEVPSKTD